jgi:CTP:molybdopterin cytidylyltransferase MocA
MKLLGVVLAAGAGRRFGMPKALAQSGGKRWVDHSVDVLREAGISDVVVISGAWNEAVDNAEVIHNADWEEGLSTSVALAIQTAHERGVARLILTVVDIPSLTAEHVRSIVEAPYPLVQATYDGEPGHPVAIDSSHFQRVQSGLKGDQGARGSLLKHGVHDLPLPGNVRDVDYPLSSGHGES